MEVKIGVTNSPREIVFQSDAEADAVAKTVADALGGDDDGVLDLTDEKGRRFLIAVSKVSYVEIGPADQRRVGFA